MEHPAQPFLWLLRLRGLCVRSAILALAWPGALVQAQDGAPPALPEVRVTGTGEQSGDAGTGPVALDKQGLAAREIPRSVDVLTRKQLDARAFTRLDEALKSLPGITVTRLDGAGNYSTIQSRGFDIGALLLDGMPIADGANFSTRPDLFLYERVEVLRGPAGLLQGVGEPGGAVNLVRKRAPAEPQFEAGLRVGSFGLRRLQADLGRRLNDSGSVRGRLVAVEERRDSYVDLLFANRHALYGTLEWDLTPSTVLSIGATRQHLRGMDDQGLPAYADGRLLDLPRSSFVGSRENRQDFALRDHFLELEHHLADGGLVKAALRSVRRANAFRSGRAASPVAPDGSFTFARVDFKGVLEDRSADLYLAQPFTLDGRSHRLLLGATHNRRETLDNNFAVGPRNRFDLFQRDYQTAPYPDLVLPGYLARTERVESALYGQLQWALSERWRLLAGGRMGWAREEVRRTSDGQVTASRAPGRQFTPQLAAMVDLTPQLMAYASHAESFVVQSAVDALGRLLPPRRARQFELGLKGELLDGRLQAQAALFRIDERDRALADPALPSAFIAGGQVRSEGLELQLKGRPTARWELQAGYAYTRTRYLRAPVAEQGQAFAPYTPRHALQLGTDYRWGQGPWRGLSLGGGLSWRSRFYAQAGNVQVVSGRYALVRMHLGYAFDRHLQLDLAIENLLDKRYYEQVSAVNWKNYYGAPRSIALSLSYRY